MDFSAVSPAGHAPAKINLALHVTGRRPDGFHLIESLAVFTRHGDRLTVAAAAEDALSVSGPFGAQIPLDNGNLVVRARDALRQAHLCRPSRRSMSPPMANLPISPLAGEMSGRTEGGNIERDFAEIKDARAVAIRLEKNLPIASGIGGGSSDAAATLKALAQLWKFGWTLEQLAGIGLPLGADVAMCLYAQPLIARGMGEKIEPVAGFPALPMVLVNPGVPVSTPQVFAALSSRQNPPLPPLPRNLDFETLLGWLAGARNDLQIPAVSIAPAIAEALDALASAGAGFARMSGSGATCFGLFETGGAAARAAAEIRERRPQWWVAATESLASEDHPDDAT